MSKNQWIIVGIGLLAVLSIGALWNSAVNKGGAPESLMGALGTASSTPPAEPVAAAKATASFTVFPLNATDHLSSWNFAGAYSHNETLVAQARADIEHLTGLVGKGQYDDYDLYNGIANDYGMLGDGKMAYEQYNNSIRVHPKKGLAYANLAHLMDQLGAFRTAADAYSAAVRVEPGTLEYHVERMTFLTEHFASENTLILSALADTKKQFGDTPGVLAIEAKWLGEQGKYADAIKVWETVKMLSPEDRQAAIDTEITRLQAKQ